MGINRRYEEKYDRLYDERAAALRAAGLHSPKISEWEPPWGPIRISADEWIIMRDSKTEPAAIIRQMRMGFTNDVFWRVVTWAQRSEDRELVGYFPDFKAANQSVKFSIPTQTGVPDVRDASAYSTRKSAPPATSS